VTNLSEADGLATDLQPGVEVTISPGDGGINVFGRDASNHLHVVRWKPSDIWRTTDVTNATGGASITLPMSGTSSGNKLLLASAGQSGVRTVVVFNFLLDSLAWSAEATSMIMEP
jgi:hypothetical protein